MKNLRQQANDNKVSTFAVIISIITTVFGIIQGNAELLGINAQAIMIISLVITTAKLVYDKFFTENYSEADLIDFAEKTRDQSRRLNKEDVKEWEKLK